MWVGAGEGVGDEGGRGGRRWRAVDGHGGHVVIAAHHGHAHGGGVGTAAVGCCGGDGGGGGRRGRPRTPTGRGALLGPEELLRLDGRRRAPAKADAAADAAGGGAGACLVDVAVAVPSSQAVDALAALRHVAHAGSDAPPAVDAAAHQAAMAEEVDVAGAQGTDVGVRYAWPPVVAISAAHHHTNCGRRRRKMLLLLLAVVAAATSGGGDDDRRRRR